MKLEEIIETVKHDVDYFATSGEPFQRGRLWEARKILDMLYQLERLDNEGHEAQGAACASGAVDKTVSGRFYTDQEIEQIKNEAYDEAVNWLK